MEQDQGRVLEEAVGRHSEAPIRNRLLVGYQAIREGGCNSEPGSIHEGWQQVHLRVLKGCLRPSTRGRVF